MSPAWIRELCAQGEFEDLSLAPSKPYCHRWKLEEGVYLHHFIGEDWARDPHDHPKTFTSIGLMGSYTEQVFVPGTTNGGVEPSEMILAKETVWVAPWVRTFASSHIHRIVRSNDCWTLVFVGERESEWGFWTKNAEWIPFERYIQQYKETHTA